MRFLRFGWRFIGRRPRRPLGRYRYVRLRWRLLFATIDALGTLAFGVARFLRAALARALARRSAKSLGFRWVPGAACLPLNAQERASRPRHPSRPPATPSDQPRTILLIQLDHLGDAVISTVMFPHLRRRYPNARIEVLASPSNCELFEAVPEVDHVHLCPVNRFARRRRAGWALSALWWGLRLRRRVDLGIDVRGEFPHAVILWLSGARRRLGWDCGGGGFLLTDKPRFVLDRPEVQSRLALLAELGIRPTCGDGDPRPVIRPAAQVRRRVARRLAALERSANEAAGGHRSAGPRIVVHVGAGTPAKAWPPEHWRELVGRLVVELAAQVVLVGGPHERAVAHSILGTRPWPDVADWTGELSLLELAALLDEADLFVGADSGPAHLAAAVGTRAVVLFSGTNSPRQWQPCGENVHVLRHRVACSPCHRGRCPQPDHPCMTGLAPQRVADAVRLLCCGASAPPRGGKMPVSYVRNHG